MNSRHRTPYQTFRRSVFLGVAVFLSVITQQQIVDAASITNTSPAAVNSDPQGIDTHFIRKNSNLGDARLDLWGYWSNNTGRASDKYFKIYYSGQGGNVCNISGSSGSRVMQVTVTAGGATSVFYIRGSNVCTSATNSNHVNDPSAGNSNLFYARYPLPAQPVLDGSGSGYYKARIQVRFAGDANENTNARELVTIGGGGSTYVGQHGQDGLTGEQARANTKFPILARLEGTRQKSTGINVPFGMPCNVGSSAGNGVTIPLYDADNGSTAWPSMLVRMKVWDVTDRVFVRMSNPAGGALDQGGMRFTPGNGEIHESSANINMIPEHRYELQVTGIAGGDTVGDISNYIAIGLPFDSIFGAISCPGPTVTASPSGVALGGIVTYSGRVSGASDARYSWEIDAIKFPANRHISSLASVPNSNTGQSCSAYAGRDTTYGGTGCKTVYGPETSTLPASSGDQAFSIPSTDSVGTQYCFVTSVRVSDSGSGQWKHSAPSCVVVGVYPSVQFLGYDVRTGGLAVAHPFTIGSGTFGSWGEFGVFSRGANTDFASGAGLAGHLGSSSSSQQDWSSLTLANCKVTGRTCPVSNYFGNFGNTVTYPSGIVAGLANMCNSSNTVPDGTTIPANSTISGTKYICSNGTVTIGGDQTYASANTSDSSLPQQIIVANGIKIASGVQTVDSWLVATGTTISNAQRGSAQGGTINTCSDATAVTKLTTNLCSKQLTVVGPVVTKELDLLRTYYKTNGVTYDPTVPAETFNLRADAFLWAYQGNGNGTPVAQTTSVTNLPPRF